MGCMSEKENFVQTEAENMRQDTNKTDLMGCMMSENDHSLIQRLRSENDDSLMQRLRTRDRTQTRPS